MSLGYPANAESKIVCLLGLVEEICEHLALTWNITGCVRRLRDGEEDVEFHRNQSSDRPHSTAIDCE